MKFGQFELVRWHQDVTPEDSIRRAMEKIELGDEIGMDEIWLAEHHFSRHGLVSGIFSLLGNVAARTKNARIGTAIVVLPFHQIYQREIPDSVQRAFWQRLNSLQSDHGVAIFDANLLGWQERRDLFLDTDHLNASGARALSQPLCDEVIAPILARSGG